MRKQRLRHALITDEELPAVNLTPLIDVVFVILIVFILVAPVLELDKVELAGAPEQGAAPLMEDAGAIVIHVDKDNKITCNRIAVGIERLGDLLKAAKARVPDARLQLFHDKSASFGTYQAVKNHAEGAGFMEMDVVLKPGA